MSVNEIVTYVGKYNNQYALEFRHPSWNIEGPWEMLKHYDIAAVMTDSPISDNGSVNLR